MAFDRNDPADLLALKTEVNDDPIGMGYSGANNTQQLLALLSDPDSNIGGESTNVELTAEVLLDVLDTDDFASNQVDQGERDWIKMCFDYALTGISIEKYRAKIKGIFQVNYQTNQNIDNLIRTLSRAEVLFGAGTIITKYDWFAARDS